MVLMDHRPSKEIWLQSHAVSGLVMMNKNKISQRFDSVFIKAILIGFCTVKKIKESEAIEKEIADLVKGTA